MAIFNGQGTKGCLQTPFFAKQMKDFLLYGKEIDKEVNIQRVYKHKKQRTNQVS
jgi:hypothetical protein